MSLEKSDVLVIKYSVAYLIVSGLKLAQLPRKITILWIKSTILLKIVKLKVVWGYMLESTNFWFN